MIQKDYLIRMIEMLGDLPGAMLGFIRKGDFTRATENLNHIYFRTLKQDSVFFRNFTESDLTDKLLQEHNYTNGHLEILAEFFNAEAELSLPSGNKESALAYTREALILFDYVDKAYKTYSHDRLDKINTLRERLNPIS